MMHIQADRGKVYKHHLLGSPTCFSPETTESLKLTGQEEQEGRS